MRANQLFKIFKKAPLNCTCFFFSLDFLPDFLPEFQNFRLFTYSAMSLLTEFQITTALFKRTSRKKNKGWTRTQEASIGFWLLVITKTVNTMTKKN